MGRTFAAAFSQVWTQGGSSLWAYFGGALGYLAFERVVWSPLRLYVFGHELTHAISCWLSGGQVYEFHASAKGGHVKLSKTNVWISLSPYFVPLYTVLLILFCRILSIWFNLAHYAWLIHALIGASLAFHVSLTVFALKCHQPDLQVLGWLPSMSLIFWMNGLCITLLLACLFPHILHMGELTRAFGSSFGQAVGHMSRYACLAWQKLHVG